MIDVFGSLQVGTVAICELTAGQVDERHGGGRTASSPCWPSADDLECRSRQSILTTCGQLEGLVTRAAAMPADRTRLTALLQLPTVLALDPVLRGREILFSFPESGPDLAFEVGPCQERW